MLSATARAKAGRSTGKDAMQAFRLIPLYLCNPLIPGVRITVSVRDTTYHIDVTFLVVRLSRFQFQKSFSNILDFSGFFGIFLDYFGKSP